MWQGDAAGIAPLATGLLRRTAALAAHRRYRRHRPAGLVILDRIKDTLIAHGRKIYAADAEAAAFEAAGPRDRGHGRRRWRTPARRDGWCCSARYSVAERAAWMRCMRGRRIAEPVGQPAACCRRCLAASNLAPYRGPPAARSATRPRDGFHGRRLKVLPSNTQWRGIMGKRLSRSRSPPSAATAWSFPLPIFAAARARRSARRWKRSRPARAGRLPPAMNAKPHLLLPWPWEVVHHPAILDAVEDLLGPDLLCFGTSFIIKNAGDERYVTWHQDQRIGG